MKLSCLLALITWSFYLQAQNVSPKDSLTILSRITDWNASWNTKDHQLAAKWYTDKAHFTNAFGDKRTGRTQIESLLKEVFSMPFVMAGTSETSDHIFQYTNPETVIVHTTVIRKGQQLPDGSLLPDRRTTHLRVFVLSDNNWQITAHLISDARDKQIPKH